MNKDRLAAFTDAILAIVMTILVLETMHFITRTHGEKEFSVTLSPVTNDELLEMMKTLKDKGADIESFTLTEGVAVFELRIKQKDYATTVDTVLSFAKGLKVEIS